MSSACFPTRNAAEYLGRNGTAAVESALLTRFTAWHDRWAGHESDLRVIPGQRENVLFDIGAGQRMLQALACGQGWLTREAQLRALVTLAVGETQVQQARGYLQMWEIRPWMIRFAGKGQFEITQYHAMSLDLAKAKLLQFPKGSEFQLSVTGQDGEAAAFRQLYAFAVGHDFVIR